MADVSSSPPDVNAEISRPVVPGRLYFIDVLRGLDMFWIVGGSSLVIAITDLLGPEISRMVRWQLHHPDWEGFTLYDTIFPLFMFIMGLTFGCSTLLRFKAGQDHKQIYIRIIRRTIMLIFLGMVFNDLLQFNFTTQRLPSVLGFLGTAYLIATMIVLHLSFRNQAIVVAAILIGYWAIMTFIPVPGHGAGVLTRPGNFAVYVTRLLTPGKLFNGVEDPEGILMTIPASCHVIFGTWASALLLTPKFTPYRKVILLSAAGVALLILGCAGDAYWFPIIKSLQTSTFVLTCSGISFLFLALTYLVVEIWGIQKPFFLFALIGMNPIFIYMVASKIGFDGLNAFLFGGAIRCVPEMWSALAKSIGYMSCEFMLLYIMYRKRIFLRV